MEDAGLCPACCAQLNEEMDKNGTWPEPGAIKPPPPIVGNEDPVNSHRAAALIEPSRESKRGQVLALLRSKTWVSGVELQEVGSSEGLRRVRELRQMGYVIEAEPTGTGTTWKYRLR